RSDVTLQEFADLPPRSSATLKVVAALPPASFAPASLPTPAPASPPKLQAFLAEEIRQGQVTVSPSRQGTLVRIHNRGLFATGSATVQENFIGLLDKIGAEIAKERTRAIVIGHTDNVPINTLAFPSNWQLSQERARQVARILARHVPAALITAEGRGQT